ncbi:MAG: hypothetical protein PHC80_07915 [Eubacteriales bacterium]|nr:hypothetical protein [Eubacteriales bacterium]
MRQREAGGVFNRLIARMRTDKRFEGAVYLVLLFIAAAVYLLAIKLPEAQGNRTPGYGEDAAAAQLEEALSSMRGVGEAKVMITREEGNAVRGVIVIAQGTEDFAVKLNVQDAVCTVLGIEAGRVEIFEMQERMEED